MFASLDMKVLSGHCKTLENSLTKSVGASYYMQNFYAIFSTMERSILIKRGGGNATIS